MPLTAEVLEAHNKGITADRIETASSLEEGAALAARHAAPDGLVHIAAQTPDPAGLVARAFAPR